MQPCPANSVITLLNIIVNIPLVENNPGSTKAKPGVNCTSNFSSCVFFAAVKVCRLFLPELILISFDQEQVFQNDLCRCREFSVIIPVVRFAGERKAARFVFDCNAATW